MFSTKVIHVMSCHKLRWNSIILIDQIIALGRDIFKMFLQIDLCFFFFFFFLKFLLFLLQIANYIPSDEDLDYPAKLERSVEITPETTSVKHNSLLVCPIIQFIYV